MVIAILMFFFSKDFSFIFFGQIWSQNLKFYKMTEISYSDTLLYDYYDFNVYFFKIFVSHIFWDKFAPKTWSFPNWLKFRTEVHSYILTTILMLIFSKFWHSHNFGQICFQNLSPNWLKFDTRAYCYMLITVFICNFSKNLLFINFWGKFYPKTCRSLYLLKFSIEIWRIYVS